MMSLSCKDMGATDCDYVAKGNSADEVKSKIMDHAMKDHKDMMDRMDSMEKEKMMKMMDEKMMAA